MNDITSKSQFWWAEELQNSLKNFGNIKNLINPNHVHCGLRDGAAPQGPLTQETVAPWDPPSASDSSLFLMQLI